MNTAKKLERRREKLGWSLQRLRDRVRDRLGDEHTPSIETFRRICADGDAAVRADPILLATICDVLGLDLVDTAPETARYLLDVGRRIPAWCGVVDLRECAPWELNPQPADNDSVAGQTTLFDYESAAA